MSALHTGKLKKKRSYFLLFLPTCAKSQPPHVKTSSLDAITFLSNCVLFFIFFFCVAVVYLMTKGHRITRVITKQPALSFELCSFSVPSSSIFCFLFLPFWGMFPHSRYFFACFRYSRLLLRRIFLLRNAVLASVASYRPSYTYIYACRLYTSGCVCIFSFLFFFRFCFLYVEFFFFGSVRFSCFVLSFQADHCTYT